MKISTLLLILLIPFIVKSQGVRGKLIDSKGEPLPFAGIFVKETQSGTSTNADAFYEIKLKPGTYNIVFQYLGYQSATQKVTIKDAFVDLNVVLTPISYSLGEVKIKSKGEDPAYVIIRKAIAMAKFYQFQVQEYETRVYVKGSGRIKKVPFLLRKTLKEEGLDTSTVYMVENISDITYIAPSTFKERVISVRSTIPDGAPSPMNYIRGNIYNTDINGAISPLSPKAFAYYRFVLDGSFFDGQNMVSKIKVIPRSNGDDVFTGSIYIVDNLWCVHSLSLTTFKEGFKINIGQIFSEVQTGVWMPASQNFNVSGSIYGFAFEGKYQTSASNYKIKLNPNLKAPKELIDEKTEEEKIPEATRLKTIDKNNDKEMEALLSGEKKLTRKDMKKLMNQFEKEEKKKDTMPEIEYRTEMKIDSNAYKMDSAFWAEARAIPLSEREIKSYDKKDSVIKNNAINMSGDTISIGNKKNKDSKDTLKKKKAFFSFNDLIFGRTFRLDSSTTLKYVSPLMGLQFNTVEGYALDVQFDLVKRFKNKHKLTLSPIGRYSFARDWFSGRGIIQYDYGKNKGNFSIEGGRYISQFNDKNPISYTLNTMASLTFERNFAKIYEKEYLKFDWNQRLNPELKLNFNSEFATRYRLKNSPHAKSFWSWKTREFASNSPENIELPNTDFDINDAFITQINFTATPWKKYYMENGKKYIRNESLKPEISFGYKKGWKDVFGSNVDFDLVEAGIYHSFEWGIRGDINLGLNGGYFLNNNNVYFTDFKHFMGNQTIFQTKTTGYRMLNYYNYSTKNYFAETFVHYQTRKFLVTQIAAARMLGLKENLIFNYLHTSNINYMEFGYGLDNIFRFMRLEFINSFSDFNYNGFAIRIGISGKFADAIK